MITRALKSAPWRDFIVMSARTQWRVEADTHQVKPVAFHVINGVERVLTPLKRFVR